MVAKISEDALAAVTYVFPINMLIVAFGVGTGVGVNSLIARRLGAKNFEEANYAAEHGLRLALINWALFAVFGAFFAKLFMSSYSDIPHIVNDGTAYMRITTIGSIFVMISMMTEKTLQARGNMILPMVSSLIGALTNIVLDNTHIRILWYAEARLNGCSCGNCYRTVFKYVLLYNSAF